LRPVDARTRFRERWGSYYRIGSFLRAGKIQRYLRSYGKRMLDELQTEFVTPGPKKTDKRHIFVHWLQNVANMPVELMEPTVVKLCKENDLSIADRVDLADAFPRLLLTREKRRSREFSSARL
jgi:hypothetical protein